jgi:Na+-driven multidrug efflux pump
MTFKNILKIYLYVLICVVMFLANGFAILAPFALGMGNARELNEHPWFYITIFIFGLPLLMLVNAVTSKYLDKLQKEIGQ